MDVIYAIELRSLSPEARHEWRVQVIRLRKAGRTYEEIAAQTGLSRTVVFDICKRHEAGGVEALRDAPSGRQVGDKRQLSAEQETALRRLIVDKTPDQLKMVYALWTRAAVAEPIRDRFGIKLALCTMGLYLERTGFTPQKPMKKAYEQSPAAVKQGIDEEDSVIEACAKVEGAEIHWGDETGMRSDDVRDRGYAPKGQPPVIRFNSKRHGLSVTDKGTMRVTAYDCVLTADILIDLMKRLVGDAGLSVYLILDNLGAHHN